METAYACSVWMVWWRLFVFVVSRFSGRYPMYMDFLLESAVCSLGVHIFAAIRQYTPDTDALACVQEREVAVLYVVRLF